MLDPIIKTYMFFVVSLFLPLAVFAASTALIDLLSLDC